MKTRDIRKATEIAPPGFLPGPPAQQEMYDRLLESRLLELEHRNLSFSAPRWGSPTSLTSDAEHIHAFSGAKSLQRDTRPGVLPPETWL